MLPWMSLLSGGLTGMAADCARHAVRSLVCREVEKRALREAEAQAASLLRETRLGIYCAILWQNMLLISALWLSWRLASVIPFCLGYLVVASYSVGCVIRHRQHILQALRTRSLFAVLRGEVRDAIVAGLQRLGTIERLVVVHLGPDLEVLSENVARRIYPAVRSACFSLGATLTVSFLFFRVWLVPTLAHGLLR